MLVRLSAIKRANIQGQARQRSARETKARRRRRCDEGKHVSRGTDARRELILVNLPQPFSLALHFRQNILAIHAVRNAFIISFIPARRHSDTGRLLIIGNDDWLSAPQPCAPDRLPRAG